MKKIALIVQRGGLDVVGGSEEYAFQMGKILAKKYHVDILTTCAKEYSTWENFYKEGVEPISNQFNYIRFKVDFTRSVYWTSLHSILNEIASITDFINKSDEEKKVLRKKLQRLPLGFSEEFIRHQGPYSTNFLDYIDETQDEYDLFIFFTYLYPTTYFGIRQVRNKDKILFVPTYHDEPFSHLPVIQYYKQYNHLFLTRQEKLLAEDILYNDNIIGSLLGFGIEQFKTPEKEKNDESSKYFLYAGRLDPSKSVDTLYNMFIKFTKKNPNYKLVTIGKGSLEKSGHPSILYKGFVDEKTKFQLMKGAIAFIHPSALESLGIVIMESFMMGTPVIVNAKSKVLTEHAETSKGGLTYYDQESFENCLNKLVINETRSQLAFNGYEYYLTNYSQKTYENRIFQIVNNTLSNQNYQNN